MFQNQFVITERCNLACRYCYMQNKQSDMTSEIFQKSLFFIENEIKPHMTFNTMDPSLIAFFGGEPLLNIDLIRDNLKLINTFQRKVLPSNGTLLTPEILSFLEKNKIHLSISFDGEYGNTKNRINLEKKETFCVFNDIQYDWMKKNNCKVMLYPNMFEKLVETYLFFYNKEIYFPDFTLVRDNIYTDVDIKKYSVNLKDLTDCVIEQNLKKQCFSIPGILLLYILDTFAYKLQKQKRPFGCFAGVGGVGIMPSGKIYPCARFGTNDKFELADTKTGKVNLDVIKFFKAISNPQEFQKCKRCFLYNICNAGCSFSQLKNGNWNRMEPIESVCELLKISYRESFRFYKIFKNDNRFLNYINRKIYN